jgi:hypothetical protein
MTIDITKKLKENNIKIKDLREMKSGKGRIIVVEKPENIDNSEQLVKLLENLYLEGGCSRVIYNSIQKEFTSGSFNAFKGKGFYSVVFDMLSDKDLQIEEIEEIAHY